MPEYLAPGVYVEETSFRSKSIEGVSTSTAGFVGPTRYGPVSGDPELVTSFLDFQRIYGDLEDLVLSSQRQANYLAHAVRAFFEEGGRRLFVSRVFAFADDFAVTDGVPSKHYASTDTSLVSPPSPQVALRARFPGSAGNMRITLALRIGSNVFNAANGGSLARVRDYDVVHVRKGALALRGDGLFTARWDVDNQRWTLKGNWLGAAAQRCMRLPIKRFARCR